MRPSRPEFLLYAGYLAVLAGIAHAYAPTNLSGAVGGTAVLAALAVASLLEASRPPVRSPARRGIRRVAALALVLLALILLFMHAASAFIALSVVPPLAKAWAVLEVAGLVVCVGLSRRGPAFRMAAATLLFLGSVPYYGLCLWLWQAPDEGECEAIDRPGVVERLTPPEWPAERSYGFDVLYAPDRDLVFASFKMAGNLTITGWNDPNANRLWAAHVPPSARPQTAVLSLPGPTMPEYLAWDPGRAELLVTRLGKGGSELAVVAVDFPSLQVARSVAIDFDPHTPVWPPDSRSLGIFSQHERFRMLDKESFKETFYSRVPGGGLVLDAWQSPGSTRVYLSLVGPNLAELDLADPGSVRLANVTFGGGQLTAVPAAGRLFQTDLLLRALNVLDLERFELLRRLMLDYTPRSVVGDAARDLLLVGDWFGGRLVPYRMSTLEPLAPIVSVGPGPRNFAWDAGSGRLFVATKCGVVQVNVDALDLRLPE